MFAEDRSVFFDVSDFAVTATWQPSGGGAEQTAQVLLDAADDQFEMGAVHVTARDYRIGYQATQFTGLDVGETITVDGIAYIVRTVRAIDDGAVMEAVLGRFDT